MPAISRSRRISAGNTLMENHNTLIGRFDGADGMKTGYTCPSGFNLIATATRDGRTLIAVVIGEHSVEARADKAADLLAERLRDRSRPKRPSSASCSPTRHEPAEADNLRAAICTRGALEGGRRRRAARAASRSSPRPISREPSAPTPIGRRGVRWAARRGRNRRAPHYADVPIPTPRPDYTPAARLGATAD